MRSVAEHRTAALGLVAPLAPISVPTSDSDGLVLAQDVVARSEVPAWDSSAMDGYAVRHADLDPSAPVVLRVIGEVPAGSAAKPVIEAGTAVRIMTGAPVPPTADTVVPVELSDPGSDTVELRAVSAGANIRRRGEDLAPGAVVLRAGTVLRERHLGAAIAAGAGTVLVHPRPRIAVVSTGSELVGPGSHLGRGQIPDSNSHLVAAAVRAAGAVAERLGPVPDDVAALAALLGELDGRVDAVVTTGGVSVGAHDIVKELLSQWGVGFAQVAVQPGKPQGLGVLPGGTPVFCLPGNPVSVFVSFEVFVRPAVLRLAGHGALERPVVMARTRQGWRSPPGRAQYLPVALVEADEGWWVQPGPSGSHLVAHLAAATGLAIVGAAVEQVQTGQELPVMRLG